MEKKTNRISIVIDTIADAELLAQMERLKQIYNISTNTKLLKHIVELNYNKYL